MFVCACKGIKFKFHKGLTNVSDKQLYKYDSVWRQLFSFIVISFKKKENLMKDLHWKSLEARYNKHFY